MHRIYLGMSSQAMLGSICREGWRLADHCVANHLMLRLLTAEVSSTGINSAFLVDEPVLSGCATLPAYSTFNSRVIPTSVIRCLPNQPEPCPHSEPRLESLISPHQHQQRRRFNLTNQTGLNDRLSSAYPYPSPLWFSQHSGAANVWPRQHTGHLSNRRYQR